MEVAPVVQPARQAAVELAASPERPVEAVVEVAPVVQPARQAAELAALPERPVEAVVEVALVAQPAQPEAGEPGRAVPAVLWEPVVWREAGAQPVAERRGGRNGRSGRRGRRSRRHR